MGNIATNAWRQIRGVQDHSQLHDQENPPTRGVSNDEKPTQTMLEKIKKHYMILTKLLPYLWPNTWDLRLRVVVSLACLILGKVVSVSVPFAYKAAVDTLSRTGDFEFPLLAIILYGCGGLAKEFLGNLRDTVFIKVQNVAQMNAAVDLFRHLHSLSIGFHINRKTGGVLRGIDRGTRGINFLTSFLLFNILPIFLELALVCIIMIISYTAWISIVTFTIVVIYMVFTVLITEWRTKFRQEMNTAENEANDKAVDSLLNYETVKFFSAEQHEIDRYRDSFAKYNAQAQKSQASLAILNVGQSLLISVGQLSVMLMAAQQVGKGNMTVGDFVLVNTFVLQLYVPLNFLGTSYRMIKQSLTDLENMFDLLNEVPSVKDVPKPLEFHPQSGEIEFQDVKFKYNDEREVLKGISFKVPAGKQLAIVGPSGAGKTTINRLLFRFYDPTQGRILIDGIDISKVRQSDLRKYVGIVPQDTVLFNDTVRYNVQYGNFEAGDQEVNEAAQTAQILKKIEEFPMGWETKVGERGLRLSGGEKQRVAIARSVLKRPPVMIFDEATASLDTNTEREIQDNLRAAFKGRTTTVVLAHRLSTIVDSDEIIVVKDGLIVERGPHEDLLKLSGEYRLLWDKQSASSSVVKKEEKEQVVIAPTPQKHHHHH
ncbi:ATP-binding cassette, subfamily B [Acrasis kona]|uniref:ATP-binding cassette, subfamily B n=1 Tax=Acrasis kona TaxID=1008807 RepID=A0AAW2YPD7_9EUKA